MNADNISKTRVLTCDIFALCGFSSGEWADPGSSIQHPASAGPAEVTIGDYVTSKTDI
jgi:hypothetical protein